MDGWMDRWTDGRTDGSMRFYTSPSGSTPTAVSPDTPGCGAAQLPGSSPKGSGLTPHSLSGTCIRRWLGPVSAPLADSTLAPQSQAGLSPSSWSGQPRPPAFPQGVPRATRSSSCTSPVCPAGSARGVSVTRVAARSATEPAAVQVIL